MLLQHEGGTAGRNFFRLATVLCLFWLIHPVEVLDQKTLDEHGIGGGVRLSEDLYDSEIYIEFDDLYDTEAIALEPEVLTRTLLYDFHIVRSGDYISNLAVNYGLNQDSIISVNKIANTRLLQIGRVLKIPNQDGILHTVRSGETLSAISARYRVEPETVQILNELFSDKITAGTDLFIPGARLDWTRLQEINGDLFIWPVSGAVTSAYGYRRDPFNPARRQFHNGIDIRGSVGTPVRAAMAGRVSRVGWDRVLGNYVVINHHSGYRTLYAHLSVIRTRTGAFVSQGERIGDVGNTGQSTGPHLHFSVYKDGITVNPRALMR